MIDKLELLLALARSGISVGLRKPAASPSRPCPPASSSSRKSWVSCWCSVARDSRVSRPKANGCWIGRGASSVTPVRCARKSTASRTNSRAKSGSRRFPTVLGMVASLTTPFRARHPEVRFSILSCTSADVLGLLENLEVDAGLTYIENRADRKSPHDPALQRELPFVDCA